MKIKIHEHEGLQFACREGTSDFKAFDEVVVQNSYERVRHWKKRQKDKPKFLIEKGERWIDLGGNVGAFTCMALKRGATVETYEPDPFNVKMIKKNCELNNLSTEGVNQLAVVSDDTKQMTMYVGNNNQVWRNSLYKDWGNQKFTVDCINYRQVIDSPDLCVKMDIEGAEIPILESLDVFPKKLVFEWSFDVDDSMNRYRAVIDKLESVYDKIYYSNTYDTPHDVWPKEWFPACEMIWCMND